MVTVTRKDPSVEIRDVNDLYRVLKEVRAQDERLVLQIDTGDETIFEASPRRPRQRRTREERAQTDEAAFLSSAGSWRGHLDPERFKRQIKAARGSRRPFVEMTLPDE